MLNVFDNNDNIFNALKACANGSLNKKSTQKICPKTF